MIIIAHEVLRLMFCRANSDFYLFFVMFLPGIMINNPAIIIKCSGSESVFEHLETRAVPVFSDQHGQNLFPDR